MKTLHNPNPIKLTKDEQQAFDDIISELESLVFGKWKKQKGQIGSKTIIEKNVKIHRFDKPSQNVIIRIVGRKGWIQERSDYIFGSNSGVYYPLIYIDVFSDKVLSGRELNRKYALGHTKTATMIEVDISGFIRKNTIFEEYNNNPFSYWVSLVNLKQTLRHEMTHAKDPDRLNKTRYSTGEVRSRFGYAVYINDPNRTEFRAHLTEWDLLTTEIQKVVLNRNKNDFYRGVWSKIKDELCPIIESKNQNDKFIELLTTQKTFGVIPALSAEQLNQNKDFAEASQRKDRSVIKYLEQVMKEKVWDKEYNRKLSIYKDYETFKRLDASKLRVEGFSRDEAKKKAVAIAKERFKKKYPDASFKKPYRKKSFSPKELEKIQKRSRRNYTDLINAIFTMFKDKGLLDKSLCTDKKTASEIARERRAMVLLKREKIVINALLSRFEDMNL